MCVKKNLMSSKDEINSKQINKKRSTIKFKDEKEFQLALALTKLRNKNIWLKLLHKYIPNNDINYLYSSDMAATRNECGTDLGFLVGPVLDNVSYANFTKVCNFLKLNNSQTFLNVLNCQLDHTKDPNIDKNNLSLFSLLVNEPFIKIKNARSYKNVLNLFLYYYFSPKNILKNGKNNYTFFTLLLIILSLIYWGEKHLKIANLKKGKLRGEGNISTVLLQEYYDNITELDLADDKKSNGNTEKILEYNKLIFLLYGIQKIIKNSKKTSNGNMKNTSSFDNKKQENMFEILRKKCISIITTLIISNCKINQNNLAFFTIQKMTIKLPKYLEIFCTYIVNNNIETVKSSILPQDIQLCKKFVQLYILFILPIVFEKFSNKKREKDDIKLIHSLLIILNDYKILYSFQKIKSTYIKF